MPQISAAKGAFKKRGDRTVGFLGWNVDLTDFGAK